MAQKDLKPVRTKEEAKERGRNGGIASGKARRKKRAMKNAAKLLLDMPIAQKNVVDSLSAMGFDDEDLTNQMAMIVAMWKEAMSGNVRAAEFIRDTAGQNVEKNNDAKAREMELRQRREEFEYKKEKDAGVTMELEDLDDIEEEVYGNNRSKLERPSEAPSETKKDNSV